jgi:putative tricarboxylic transport membrane protein
LESFQFLMGGFGTALQPTNILFALLGCILGTIIGLLPGIGPAGATAILIPVTFTLDPIPAIIMLAAIYYGGMYGGTITSVLINTPGEAASAVTCLDGYEMAKKGRASAALGIAAIGSFIGGTIATVGLVLVALPLTELALSFGPPEFFGLMLVGISLVTGLASKSIIRALMSAMLGLLIAMVGMDPMVGIPRFDFGMVELQDGLQFIPVLMGLFGLGEILINIERPASQVFDTKMSFKVLSLNDIKNSVLPIARGTFIGFFLGLIPGVGAAVPAFMSYATEKKMSKNPEKFGTGVIQGVAGPETANNAYANASMIPLFTLGIPGSPTIAVLMGAFMMNGLTPGPFLFTEHPDFVWAVIASMYVGNLILLVLNLPLIPIWVALLKMPYSVLFVLILGFCILGAYSLENTVFDVGVMVVFGIIGYTFRKLDIPLAPIALTLILGPLMEKGLRQSLIMSRGDFGIFLTRPIALGLIIVASLIMLSFSLRTVAQLRGGDSQV